MTWRQKILKLFYPLFTLYRRKGGRATVLANEKKTKPPVSFYHLHAVLTNGRDFSFEKLRGKKVLVVNTASDCGYTFQYDELQKLYDQSNEILEIIAFPSNDFKEQEKANDEEIAAFCRRNYGVEFLLAKKSKVRKSAHQHDVFRWLTHLQENGWNEKQPSWNFSKYLVNEEGMLTHYFDPAISPLSDEMRTAIVSGE